MALDFMRLCRIGLRDSLLLSHPRPLACDRERATAECPAQPPPTLRGVRVRGTKPRAEVALHGWCVWCFGARMGAGTAGSDDWAAASAADLARSAAACASSLPRQQCLYLRPEPQ
jgi:hypothetical protein